MTKDIFDGPGVVGGESKPWVDGGRDNKRLSDSFDDGHWYRVTWDAHTYTFALVANCFR